MYNDLQFSLDVRSMLRDIDYYYYSLVLFYNIDFMEKWKGEARNCETELEYRKLVRDVANNTIEDIDEMMIWGGGKDSYARCYEEGAD